MGCVIGLLMATLSRGVDTDFIEGAIVGLTRNALNVLSESRDDELKADTLLDSQNQNWLLSVKKVTQNHVLSVSYSVNYGLQLSQRTQCTSLL